VLVPKLQQYGGSAGYPALMQCGSQGWVLNPCDCHTPPGGAPYAAQFTPAHGSTKSGKNGKNGKNGGAKVGKNGKNGGAAGVEEAEAADRALSPTEFTAAILK
jgi:hypothetical protein